MTFANVGSDANNRARATVAAVYIQDQIRLSPMFEIVAGLRFDSFKLKVDDFHGAGTEFSRKDELLSPRLGPDLQADAQSVASMRITAAPICRSPATSSAGSLRLPKR